MKKIYSLIVAFFFTLISINVNAVTISVDISNFAFSPSSFTANVGDVVMFMVSSGTHSVASTSVPSGADPISSGTMTTTSNSMYDYVITKSGNYSYHCLFHASMTATFTVTSPMGISAPSVDIFTSVYPSPFKEKVNVKYSGIESVEFFNIVGEKIISVELPSYEGKIEIDTEALPTGIYFYRTYKDGIVFETKKIIKAK
jgi:plastocyanin